MKPLKLPEFTTLDHATAGEHTGLSAFVRKVHAMDVLLSEKYIAHTPLHSVFWIVTRMRKAIRQHARHAHGRMLDVGCGLKPHKATFAPYVTEHIGIDYSPASGYRGNRADVSGDAMKLPFADESFDTVLCTELLVDVPDANAAISEFARVLKPDGTLITTAAFVYPVHDKNDYFRFSPAGLASMMERHGLTVDRVVPMSGTAVTLAVMINMYWYDLHFLWNKWLYPIGLLLRPVLWLICLIINLLGGLFEVILPDRLMAFNHLTLAYKFQDHQQLKSVKTKE